MKYDFCKRLCENGIFVEFCIKLLCYFDNKYLFSIFFLVKSITCLNFNIKFKIVTFPSTCLQQILQKEYFKIRNASLHEVPNENNEVKSYEVF